MCVTAVAEPTAAALPYRPLVSRLLGPLRRGFLVLNRGFMAPLIRRGFGWLIGNPVTGHVMLLRTRGRRTGILREAPLGYVVRDGCVYCVAGYGEPTLWFRNLLAEPTVEVILPNRRFQGNAEPVTDSMEWLAAYRELVASFGLLGRATVGDVRSLDDATLLARHRTLPVVRITPIDRAGTLAGGPFDPGGHGWMLPYGAAVAIGVLAWLRLAPSRRRTSQAPADRSSRHAFRYVATSSGPRTSTRRSGQGFHAIHDRQVARARLGEEARQGSCHRECGPGPFTQAARRLIQEHRLAEDVTHPGQVVLWVIELFDVDPLDPLTGHLDRHMCIGPTSQSHHAPVASF